MTIPIRTLPERMRALAEKWHNDEPTEVGVTYRCCAAALEGFASELESALAAESDQYSVPPTKHDIAVLDSHVRELIELLRYDGKTLGDGVVVTGESTEAYRQRTSESPNPERQARERLAYEVYLDAETNVWVGLHRATGASSQGHDAAEALAAVIDAVQMRCAALDRAEGKGT